MKGLSPTMSIKLSENEMSSESIKNRLQELEPDFTSPENVGWAIN
jgi:hypothetical protein